MFIFGEVAPPPTRWWAPWAQAAVFAALAALLTYGTVTWGAPRDRGGGSSTMWLLVVGLWLLAAVATGKGVIATIRRRRRGR